MGPPQIQFAAKAGIEGSINDSGSNGATTSHSKVAAGRPGTDGNRRRRAIPTNLPPTIRNRLQSPIGDPGFQYLVLEAVQAAVQSATVGMADLLGSAAPPMHDQRPPMDSSKLVVPVYDPVTDPVQIVEEWTRKVDQLSAMYSRNERQTASCVLTKLE